MTRIAAIIIGIAVVTEIVLAAPLVVEMTVAGVPTNGAAASTNTSTTYVTGELKSIQIVRSGNTANGTNTFIFYAQTNNAMATKLISWTTNSADASISPQATAAGQSFRFPIVNQRIQMLTQDANQAGITATVYVIYEGP